MADHPLRPATDLRLGEPLPHQLANPTSAAQKALGLFPAAVRLACVNHAASVQSEPGSNSFVYILTAILHYWPLLKVLTSYSLFT